MRDYVHWATLGALCEFLPQPDNRVTLADETDRHGLPVAHFSYSQVRQRQAADEGRASSRWKTILHAAGAEEVITIDRYAHLVGGARMAARPEDGVVDADHRVFGVPNLFIVDGSVLPTQGAANPALTIMALAARAADRLRALGRAGATDRPAGASMTAPRPADRRHHAPPSTGSPPRNPRPTARSPGTPPPPSPRSSPPAGTPGSAGPTAPRPPPP